MTTFRTIHSIRDSVIVVVWSQPFHLVFIELSKNNYYLASVEATYNRSITITKLVTSSDRCHHISEVFNQTIVELHRLRRLKYYHLACQNYSLDLSCFYDDVHLCFCYNYGQKRLANCFEFNHSMSFDCLGQNECENGGQCFQDTPDRPQQSMCLCPVCFYGRRCQFTIDGFGLSLDNILGYHILPRISIKHQPKIVKVSIALTMIFIIAGFINGLFAIMTFKNKNVREVGCGLYLFGSAITTVLITLVFGFKFWIFVFAQMSPILNQSFLRIQCVYLDFILRVFLNMDQWLNACVAGERAITVIQGTRFIKKKSVQVAKFVIVILLIFNIAASIYDPMYRRLIEEENDEKRIWCVVNYPSNLKVFNSVIQICQFFAPFLINLISAIILITKKSHQLSNLRTNVNRRVLLRAQYQQHRHLFIAPVLLVLLAVPRLIISFMSKFMYSSSLNRIRENM